MKKLPLIFLAALTVVIPFSISSAQLGPVWHGPQKAERWAGLALPVAPAAKTVPAIAPTLETVPVWVGYIKRAGSWSFRVMLSGQKTESLVRAGTTSDGWTLVDFTLRAGRPATLILTKGGETKTISLSLPAHAATHSHP